MNNKDLGSEEINKLALQNLFSGKLNEAQNFFEINATENPSFITLNNFGAFCYKNLRTDKSNPAISLLKSALKHKNNFRSNIILGDIYLYNKKYNYANSFYHDALKLSEIAELHNNYAISLYYQKKFTEAKGHFSQSIKMIDKEYKYIPASSEVASLINIKDYNQASDTFDLLIQKIDQTEVDFSLLHLAYGCRKYDFVINNCYKALEGWVINDIDYKYIISAFVLEAKLDEAQKFKIEVFKTIQEYEFLNTKQIQQFDISYNKAISSKGFDELIYVPEVLSQEYLYYFDKIDELDL